MKSLLLASGLFMGVAVHSAVVTESYGSGLLDLAITDNSAVLTPSLLSITGSVIASLTKVEVRFELIGSPDDSGFANDMFVSLLKSAAGGPITVSDPSAVLLNRVASAHDGWNVTLNDSAPASIQTASPTLVADVLSGTFRPEDSLFAAFGGGLGNGDWRFNVGDLAANGTMKLVSWTLILTGETASVPEPSTWAAGGALLLAAGATWRRARRR